VTAGKKSSDSKKKDYARDGADRRNLLWGIAYIKIKIAFGKSAVLPSRKKMLRILSTASPPISNKK